MGEMATHLNPKKLARMPPRTGPIAMLKFLTVTI